ncbi:hypothetical protein XI06_16050 [Bradyrhizobium sp. CCBAU 11434]|uniref:hypothetical protein n=1 Tax=Bradyrhizobium sp. CCBAU 11434 TaxID=1630885 RepID=UPI00230655C7|nr:hypothetical protein [Bradyrhizobium sp. CCBAU 11434]MDA9521793.1 hypothetical protein [Bradyrhizobium sp. CCBAU 11434]
MTMSRLFVTTIAVTAALATPAFSQWESRGPAAFDRAVASRAARNTMANLPSTSPRPTVIRATKGQ